MRSTHPRARPALAALFALAAAAAGCGAFTVIPGARPKLTVPANAAQVCIVRRGSDGASTTYPIRDNGILVGATIGGSCFCYLAGAGAHELEARSDGFDLLQLDAIGGTEYTILQTTSTAVGIIRSRLEMMDPIDGKQAMDVCQYSVLAEVPDGTYKPKPEAVVAPR